MFWFQELRNVSFSTFFFIKIDYLALVSRTNENADSFDIPIEYLNELLKKIDIKKS